MTTAPDSAARARVSFKTSSLESGGDARAWGYLDTEHARVGVVYQRTPQPHLTFFPPVRVPEGSADAFLAACLAHARGGREEWGRLSVDPADGEVSLRLNLASDGGTEIQRALEQAAAFLDEEHVSLAKACFEGEDEDGADDDDRPGMKGLIERLFGPAE